MHTPDEKLQALAHRPVGRLLWEYSLPAVTGMIVMALYNIVDRIFVGQVVGPAAIAGMTVTFPIMNIATALGVLVGVGASARVSILLGRKETPRAELLTGNALTLTLIFGALYIAAFAMWLDQCLRAFGASAQTIPFAHEYMSWLLPGLLFINLTFSFNNIIRASGYPSRAMVTMLIGAGLNVALDPIFIYWLDMGIRGAAIATDISMAISMIFVMAHFFRRNVTLRFRRGTFGLRLSVVWSMIALGAAPSIVNIAGCLINIIINRELYTCGGDNAVAAAGIFSTFTSILVSIVIGICQGMQPIVGYNYGARRLDRLRRAYLLAIAAGTAVVAIGWCAGMWCPELIAGAFTTDSLLISVTANAFSIAMTCFWMVGFQVISTTFFQALGRSGKSIFLGLTRQVLFLVPLLLILPRYYGLAGIWASFPIGDACATIVTFALVIHEFKRLRLLNNDLLT